MKRVVERATDDFAMRHVTIYSLFFHLLKVYNSLHKIEEG